MDDLPDELIFELFKILSFILSFLFLSSLKIVLEILSF